MHGVLTRTVVCFEMFVLSNGPASQRSSCVSLWSSVGSVYCDTAGSQVSKELLSTF